MTHKHFSSQMRTNHFFLTFLSQCNPSILMRTYGDRGQNEQHFPAYSDTCLKESFIQKPYIQPISLSDLFFPRFANSKLHGLVSKWKGCRRNPPQLCFLIENCVQNVQVQFDAVVVSSSISFYISVNNKHMQKLAKSNLSLTVRIILSRFWCGA